MTETEVRTRSVTADAAEFLRALGNAALFTGGDITLPVLCAVHLRWSEGTLIAEGTDRYTACQHMIRSAAGDLPGGTLLWAKDVTRAVKRLTRELNAAVNQARQLQLTVSLADGAKTATLTLGGQAGLVRSEAVDVPDIGQSSWPAAAVDRRDRVRVPRHDRPRQGG